MAKRTSVPLKKTKEGYLEVDYSKTTLYKSLQKVPNNSRTGIYAVVRTAFYKPTKKQVEGSKETRAETSKTSFDRYITKEGKKHNIEIYTRTHYIKLSKKDALDINHTGERAAAYMRKEQARFKKSDYASMSGSVQIVRGKIVDKYTARGTPKTKVSKAATMPAFSKKPRHAPKRTAEDLKTIMANNITSMENAMVELAEYGIHKSWKPGETRVKLPLGQGEVRQMKHEDQDEEEE